MFFTTISCDLEFNGIQNPEAQPDLRTNAKPPCQSCDILFIGSSYLSYIGNDVIDIFSQFTAEAIKNARIDRRDISGWRLYNHAESEGTIYKIREREWDYVILQGNAAFLSKEEWHQYVVPYLKELREIIKENSPQTCVIYMMPWAYLDGLTYIEGETDTYEQMQENLYRETIKLVKEIDIATAPVGWAWYTAVSNDYPVSLYISDNNHQSRSGAYLSASVFYATIFEEQAPGIDYSLDERDDTEYLREVAYETVIDNLALWNIYR